MKAATQLPMHDLKLFGVYRDGKFTIPEEQVSALRNGKMTDVVELTNLKTQDVNIEKLPARLSIIKGEDGNPALRIDPVYNEANKHPLLTDFDRTRLIREEIANIKKDYVDQHGNIQSQVIEYDKATKQFFSFDPNKIQSPVAVNGEDLSQEKRRKFREGELVELADGTQLQIRSSDRTGIRSNRTGLVLSILIDGGISYLLVTGIQRLIGRKSAEQRSYSASYQDAIKEVQRQLQSKVERSPNDKEAARMLDEANDAYWTSTQSLIDRLGKFGLKKPPQDSDQERNQGKDGGRSI